MRQYVLFAFCGILLCSQIWFFTSFYKANFYLSQLRDVTTTIDSQIRDARTMIGSQTHDARTMIGSQTRDARTMIDKIPFIIDRPGIYSLERSLTSDNPNIYAILINADNVVLDFNGFGISNEDAGTATVSIGIFINNKKNVEIRNGFIRNFLFGIRSLDIDSTYADDEYIFVQNMRFLSNTFRGVKVNSGKAIIKDCIVTDTGGTTAFDDPFSVGIEVHGPNPVVTGNMVLSTYASGKGEGIGISFNDDNFGGIISNNYISNPERKDLHYGVWIGFYNKSVSCVGNIIAGFEYGILASCHTDFFVESNIYHNCSHNMKSSQVPAQD